VTSFLVLVAVDGVLLAVILSTNVFVARRLGFARQDEIAIAFCGTQKSLIMGIPMANALFAGSTLGFVVLPMIVYHQMQFMTCANIARRYARSERQRVLAVGKGD
jgi:sodium/bile acid cotransporter 7